MKDQEEEVRSLRMRTKEFALRIIKLYSALPKSTVAQTIGKQLLRCGTSVGAHYREACRAKSDADFISKMQGAMQELDESGYWLELLAESEFVKPSRLNKLHTEIDELLAIFFVIVKRVQNHKK
jgi:four helix bundle protein